MKTLVIHPLDSSTLFLSKIYADTDFTVIRDPFYSKSKLKRDILAHDVIIMLGHGTECGLISGNRYLIDSQMVFLLRKKICYGVWCDSYHFFKRYSLSGLCSGMIISEYDEALTYCLYDFSADDIKKSNNILSFLLRRYIVDKRPLKTLLSFYSKLKNPITDFNKDKFYEFRS